jgi:uncharacterized membrane protein YdbT with pleckstrin-like domain
MRARKAVGTAYALTAAGFLIAALVALDNAGPGASAPTPLFGFAGMAALVLVMEVFWPDDYLVTDRRVLVRSGAARREIPLTRITSVDYRQRFLQEPLACATVRIRHRSRPASVATVTELANVADAREIARMLQRLADESSDPGE